jgi:hypothetical protein
VRACDVDSEGSKCVRVGLKSRVASVSVEWCMAFNVTSTSIVTSTIKVVTNVKQVCACLVR